MPEQDQPISPVQAEFILRFAAAADEFHRRRVAAGLTLEDLAAEWEAQENHPAWQHNPDPDLHPDTRALLDEVERMRLDLRARVIQSIATQEDHQ